MQRRKAIKNMSLLLGASMTLPASMQLLSGCNIGDSKKWNPVFFDSEQFSFITEVSETILPRTDTPGAKDVHVPEYIDLVLQKCFSEETQISIKEFINEQMIKCNEKYNQSFLKCDAAQKEEFVLDMENLQGITPFSTLKGLVLLGYFTSEEGMKQSLDYHAIPQRYEGCITIDENAKVYADNNVIK